MIGKENVLKIIDQLKAKSVALPKDFSELESYSEKQLEEFYSIIYKALKDLGISCNIPDYKQFIDEFFKTLPCKDICDGGTKILNDL